MADDITIKRRSGYKTKLAVDVNGGTSFVDLPGVIESISGPDQQREEADVSLLLDDVEHVLPGMRKTGEVNFDYLLDPTESTNLIFNDLFLQFTPIPNWKITYQNFDGDSEQSETFFGWVKGIGREIAKAAALKRKITIRVTGDVSGAGGSGSEGEGGEG